MKRCTICKIDQNLVDFNKKASSKDGKQNVCRKCNRASSRRYYAENKDKHLQVIRAYKRTRRDQDRDFLFNYLELNPCVDCGEDDILVLEFDHVGVKKKNVTTLVGSGTKRLLRELRQCQVRCANCHRRKTHKRSNSYRYRKFARVVE